MTPKEASLVVMSDCVGCSFIYRIRSGWEGLWEWGEKCFSQDRFRRSGPGVRGV